MVINYVCQMISRITVRLEENKIIKCTVFKNYLTAQQIIERGLALERGLEAHHRDNPTRLHLDLLFWRKVAAVAVIARWLLSLHLLLTHRIQPLRRAVTMVSKLMLQQFISRLVVKLQLL